MENLPADKPPLGLQPHFDSTNPLFPSLLATVLLCSILTTIFTAARLIAKRLVSTYSVEDCECQMNFSECLNYSPEEPSRYVVPGMGEHILDQE